MITDNSTLGNHTVIAELTPGLNNVNTLPFEAQSAGVVNVNLIPISSILRDATSHTFLLVGYENVDEANDMTKISLK